MAQHPQHRALTDALIPIAEEELAHFLQVYELLIARGQTLVLDAPDPYMRALRRAIAAGAGAGAASGAFCSVAAGGAGGASSFFLQPIANVKTTSSMTTSNREINLRIIFTSFS